MKYSIFITSCCEHKLYNEVEPIGILCIEPFYKRLVEYAVFFGNPMDITYKPCKDTCQFLMFPMDLKQLIMDQEE